MGQDPREVPALSSPHLPPGGAPPSPPTAGQGRARRAPLCQAEGSSLGWTEFWRLER